MLVSAVAHQNFTLADTDLVSAAPPLTEEMEARGTAGYFARRQRFAISGSTLALIPDRTQDSIRKMAPATRMPTKVKKGLQLRVFQAHDTNICNDDFYDQPLMNIESYTNAEGARIGMPMTPAVFDAAYVPACVSDPSKFGETFMRIRAATDQSGGIGYYAASGKNRLLSQSRFSTSQVAARSMNPGQSGISFSVRPVSAVLPFSGTDSTMNLFWRQLVQEINMAGHIKSAVVVNLTSTRGTCDAVHSNCRISLYLMSLNWDPIAVIPGAKIYADPVQGGLPSVIAPIGAAGTSTTLFQPGHLNRVAFQSLSSPTQNSLSPFDRVFKVRVSFDNFKNMLKSAALEILRAKGYWGPAKTVNDVTDAQLLRTFGSNALKPGSWSMETIIGHTEFTEPVNSTDKQNYIGTTFKWINLAAE